MAYSNIDKPNQYFNTVLYTGNGSARTITGVGFQPDWVWVKGRSATSSHYLYDVVRGNNVNVFSNSTSAEVDVTTGFTSGGIGSQASDGFTIVAGTSNTDNVNTNSATYASWNWLAGGTASSNTDGSITSSVSASTTSGFSIVSYTGTGATATIGHGLGVAPKFIIHKQRDTSRNWYVFTDVIDGSYDNLYLNLTDAKVDRSITLPTSSVFTVSSSNEHNESSGTYIAYCFAEKKGFSKSGSYTGNGNADGTFIYTGFKPAFVMIKMTSSTGSWGMVDNKRPGFNVTPNRLFADQNSAELTSSGNQIDILSQGFKIRSTGATYNTSGGTYIYMAFAERSLVGTNNVPALAR